MEMMPSGVYNVKYEQEIAVIRTSPQWACLLGFLTLLFLLPLFISNHIISLLNLICVYIVAGLGVQVVTGYCGQLTMGQAAFVGFGAYSSALLTIKLHIPFFVSIPLAAILTGLVGILFALPSVRIKGFYLAIASLAAHLIIIFMISAFPDLTGGTTFGLQFPDIKIWDFIFNTDNRRWYLIMPITLLMVYLIKNLLRTKTGRGLIAVRDNDLAAEVMGINIFRYKIIGFGICSSCAGVAGVLWGVSQGLIHPEQFSVMDSIWYIAVIIIGGMGSIMGVIFGTIFLTVLDEVILGLAPVISAWFPFLTKQASASMSLFSYGLVIALFMMYEPRGLNHFWEYLKAKYRLWPFPQ